MQWESYKSSSLRISWFQGSWVIRTASLNNSLDRWKILRWIFSRRWKLARKCTGSWRLPKIRVTDIPKNVTGLGSISYIVAAIIIILRHLIHVRKIISYPASRLLLPCTNHTVQQSTSNHTNWNISRKGMKTILRRGCKKLGTTVAAQMTNQVLNENKIIPVINFLTKVKRFCDSLRINKGDEASLFNSLCRFPPSPHQDGVLSLVKQFK